MERLFQVQTQLRQGDWARPGQQAVLQQLRETVPAPVLAHYLRIVEQGRNAVAQVNHGVCSECHIRIPAATLASLMRPKEVHLCENCGCYLVLPPDEEPGSAGSGEARFATAGRARGRRLAVALT